MCEDITDACIMIRNAVYKQVIKDLQNFFKERFVITRLPEVMYRVLESEKEELIARFRKKQNEVKKQCKTS